MPALVSENQEIASLLRQVADLLRAQEASPFRVRAYRRAAATLAAHPEPVRRLYERAGIGGLQALPGIGPALARLIGEYLDTGRLPRLHQLRGEVTP